MASTDISLKMKVCTVSVCVSFIVWLPNVVCVLKIFVTRFLIIDFCVVSLGIGWSDQAVNVRVRNLVFSTGS